MANTIILRKACDCLGSTSSGPRMTYVQTYPSPGTVQVTLKLVGYACERCGAEWTRETQPETHGVVQ